MRNYLKILREFPPSARWFLAGTLLLGVNQALMFTQRNLFFQESGLTESEIGRLIALARIGTVLAALFLPYGMTKWSVRRCLVLFAGLFSAATILQATFPVRAVFYPTCFLQGMGSSAVMLIPGPYFMRIAPPYMRPYLFGIHSAVFMLANFAGSGGSGVIVESIGARLGDMEEGYRTLFWIGGFLAAVSLFPLSRVRAPKVDGGDRLTLVERYRVRDGKLLARLLFPEFLIGLGAAISIHFMNLYLKNHLGATPEQVGYIFAGMALTNLVGFLSVPVLAGRWGLARVIVLAQCVSLPFLAGMGIATGLAFGTVCVLGRQVLMNMAHPMAIHFQMEIAGEADREKVSGYRSMVWHGGGMLGAWFGGIWIERYGFPAALFTTLGVYAFAIACFAFFFREHLGRPAEKPESVEPSEEVLLPSRN